MISDAGAALSAGTLVKWRALLDKKGYSRLGGAVLLDRREPVSHDDMS